MNKLNASNLYCCKVVDEIEETVILEASIYFKCHKNLNGFKVNTVPCREEKQKEIITKYQDLIEGIADNMIDFLDCGLTYYSRKK